MAKKQVVGLCLALIIVISSIGLYAWYHAIQPKPVAVAVQGTSPKLIFDEEFNGSSLDTSKWNTCYDSYSSKFAGCTNYGNFEDEWYKKSQVSVANGNLVLTAQKQATAGGASDGSPKEYSYASGMVTTGRYLTDTPPKWTSSYGYFEARMKVPAGKGVWPAFWLLPVDHQWPPEIDIMELLGDKPDQVLTTYHWQGDPGKGVPQDSSAYVSSTSIAGQWHTYAVDWRPGVLDWYIDGKRIKHFENSAVTGKPMQIILDLAVGGILPGYPDSTTPAVSTMLVDYVRVYERS